MRTKIVFFAGAAAIALLAAGCSDKVAPTAAPTVSSTASDAATSPATAAPSATPTTATTTKPAAVPVKTTTPASDPGDGGNWIAALAPCPVKGIKTQVQKLAFADVTGDGVDDALVARTCESTTSHWPSTVEVFDGTTGAKPKRLATLLEEVGSTDMPWVVSVKGSGSTVTVKAYGLSAEAPKACPDLTLTYTYKYSNGDFTRTARKAVASVDCLPIED